MMQRIREVDREVYKLYYFSGGDEESGVFVGARTWKEARNSILCHDSVADCAFIDIRGTLCRGDGGIPVYTDKFGEHRGEDLIKAGYTNFWSCGNCDKCGKWEERLNPVDGKMVCCECE